MVNRVTLTAAKDPFHTAARFGDQPAIPTVTNREKDTIARFSAIEPRKSDEVKRGSSYCSAAKQIFRRSRYKRLTNNSCNKKIQPPPHETLSITKPWIIKEFSFPRLIDDRC